MNVSNITNVNGRRRERSAKQPSKPKPSNKSSKRAQREEPKKQQSTAVANIPDCTALYATVLNDPIDAFASGVTGACVPAPGAYQSLRRAYRLRGSVTANADGYAWILLNPYAPGSTSGGSSVTTGQVRTSNSSSAWVPTMSFSAGTSSNAGVVPLPAFIHFAPGDLEYRIVAAALRVTYTGSLLNRGGIYTVLSNPHNDNMYDTSVTGNAATTYPNSVRVPIGQNYKQVRWTPRSTGDEGFQSSNDTYFSQGMIISAEPSTTYMFEAVFYYEYIGVELREQGGFNTVEQDPAGFAAVKNAVNDLPLTVQPSTASIYRSVSDDLLRVTSYIYDNGGAIAKAINVARGAHQAYRALRQ